MTRSRVLLVVIGAALALAAACIPPPPTRPECAHERLAEIEAAWLSETLLACDGYTLEACPAAPGLEAKYSALREEWIACH